MSLKITDPRLVPVRYAPETVVTACFGLEDVLLWRVLHETKAGFYLDVGAADPNFGSPTRWFYVNGWTGVNIEPHPVIFPILEQWRPKDINLNCGVSNIASELTFYSVEINEIGQGYGLSSFDAMAAEAAAKLGYKITPRSVPTMTLAEICERYCVHREIDFLKIDVEGYEETVIQSANFERFRPRVLCIEATYPMTKTPTFSKWEPMLLEADYKFAIFDGLNNFYVRSESSDLLSQFNCGVTRVDKWREARCDEFREPWLHPNDWAIASPAAEST